MLYKGNYYALKGEHEKAVQYFSRAVRLNPKFVSAYILMGHEYMEMKNIHAAIRSYRKAAGTSLLQIPRPVYPADSLYLSDINIRDYRAWYGLGQTYELLKMPHYAIYYYQKGVTLRYLLLSRHDCWTISTLRTPSMAGPMTPVFGAPWLPVTKKSDE